MVVNTRRKSYSVSRGPKNTTASGIGCRIKGWLCDLTLNSRPQGLGLIGLIGFIGLGFTIPEPPTQALKPQTPNKTKSSEGIRLVPALGAEFQSFAIRLRVLTHRPAPNIGGLVVFFIYVVKGRLGGLGFSGFKVVRAVGLEP